MAAFFVLFRAWEMQVHKVQIIVLAISFGGFFRSQRHQAD